MDSALSDRDVRFIEQIRRLKLALYSTLAYIQAELQADLPPRIKAYEGLLAEAGPEAEIPLNAPKDFLDVVVAMTRFLDLSTSSAVFEKLGVTGFADWAILMTIKFEPMGMTDRQTSRMIGMSPKRGRRMIERLVQTGFLSPGSGKNNTSLLAVTASGEEWLNAINTDLEPVLALFSRRHRMQIILTGKKIRTLARMYDRTAQKKAAS